MKFISLVVFSLFLATLSPVASAQAHNANLKRAVVTSGIEQREPVDNLNETVLAADLKKVYFFTEILNQANSAVTHRWFLNGKLEAEVVLNIGADRWRTYSSKNLDKNFHSGSWEVMVVTHDGTSLGGQTFTID